MMSPVAVAGSAGADDLDGLPIVRLHFVRHNIFDLDDPKTSSWPFRWANALHVVSRESMIRSMLVLEEGMPYSRRDAEESARILRSLGFLNPVFITAERVEGGVEVTVVTHDQWTLELRADGDLSGDRSGWSLAFLEQNLLGHGKRVKLEYSSDDERDTWAGEYFDPNILGTRWQARLQYEDSTDGSRSRVHLQRPFFSLATRRAWGGEWLDESRVEHLYAAGETTVDGRRSSDVLGAWGGLRLPGDGGLVRRLILGWQTRDDRFTDWQWTDDGTAYPTPDDRRISGPRLGFELVSDRFEVLEGFRGFAAQEDIALGPNLKLGVIASLPAFGGDRQRWLLDAAMEHTFHRDGWLVLASAWASGRLEAAGLENLRLGGQLAASQLGARVWQLRLLVEDTHDLDLDRQLTLGADAGLRGWDPDFFDGTGRALLNVQRRHLVKRDLWNVFSIGVAVFGDAGITWDARVGDSTAGVRLAAGLGLIADMTSIGLYNLLRLDVGFPDDGSGPTITVTSSALF